MEQNKGAVAAALVLSECVRLHGETDPPLSRLTARSIAERYALDWGQYHAAAAGRRRGEQAYSRAEHYLRIALADAYRGGSLARLQDKRTLKWVRDDRQFVYVDAHVTSANAFGEYMHSHQFGTEPWSAKQEQRANRYTDVYAGYFGMTPEQFAAYNAGQVG